jgi:tetratricopeptide (TPR) repeat protein
MGFEYRRPLLYLTWDGTTERAARGLREYLERGGSVPAVNAIVLRCLAHEIAPYLAEYTINTWPGARAYDYYHARAWVHLGLGQPAAAHAYWDSSRVYQEARLATDSTFPGASELAAAAVRLYFGQGPSGPLDLLFAYAGSGRHAEALRIVQQLLATLPVPTIPPISPDAAERIAILELVAPAYVMVGQYDEAITYLEELLSGPSDYSAGLLRVDPLWDPLRGDPRFQALLEKYQN